MSTPPDAREHPALRLVREALEDVLPKNKASATVDEALTEWGSGLPDTPEAWRELLTGPLREAAGKRLDEQATYRLMWSLEELLATTEVPTGAAARVTRSTPRPGKPNPPPIPFGASPDSFEVDVEVVLRSSSVPPSEDEEAAELGEEDLVEGRSPIMAPPPPSDTEEVRMEEVDLDEEGLDEKDLEGEGLEEEGLEEEGLEEEDLEELDDQERPSKQTQRPPRFAPDGTERKTGELDGSVYWPDDRITMSLPTLPEGPASMVVLSASDGFARHLMLTLGREQLHATTVLTLEELRLAGDEEPDFVLVDGGMPPESVTLDGLTEALRGLPKQTWRAVWASELEFGRTLTERLLSHHSTSCIPLAVKDGMAPLVDLVRARREGSGRKRS